jgi:hypothetical protein
LNSCRKNDLQAWAVASAIKQSHLPCIPEFRSTTVAIELAIGAIKKSGAGRREFSPPGAWTNGIQNLILAASWTVRAALAPVTTPKLEFVLVPPSAVGFAELAGAPAVNVVFGF